MGHGGAAAGAHVGGAAGELGAGGEAIRAGARTQAGNAAIRNRGVVGGIGLGLNVFDFYEQTKDGTTLTKSLVQKFPGLASSMTETEYKKLPDGDKESPFVDHLLGWDAPGHEAGWLERTRNSLFGAPGNLNGGTESSLPFRVDTQVNTTIRVEGLPQGATVTVVDSKAESSGTPAKATANVGRNWYD